MAEGGTKADDNGSITQEASLPTRGRNRICKLCKFTCTDSKEFFHHQMNAHSETEETVSKKRTRVPSLSSKGGKLDGNKGSESESNMSSNNKLVDDGMSRENSFTEDEEDRLIIAEEDSDLSSNVPPTRSGNIQNRTYVCCFCDYTSTNAKAFLHHQNDEHDQRLTIYECDVCDYATKYKQKLPRHRKLHFSGNESMLQDYQTPQEFLLQDSVGGGDGVTEQIVNETLNDEEDYDGDEEDHTGTDEAAVVVEQPATEKKKAARQEVDPAKYFEVVDDSGIKYSCSKCGNVYKWRKSLNKHWKEKHFGEIPDASRKPKGLVYLNVPSVKQNGRDGNMVTKYLLNEGGSLNNSSDEFMQFNKSINDGSRSSTPYRIGTPVQPPEDVDSVVIPQMIGPFITNSSQPIFPEMMMKDNDKRLHPGNSSIKIETVKRRLQDEPIDFSVKKDIDDMERTATPDYSMPLLKIKSEPTWGHDSNCSDLDPLDPEDFKPAALQCTKCSFVAKTLIDYSAHMTVHFSKRAFKCAECQEHFTMVEDLNKHFIDTHSNKIQEHKDALQKIPHGLQQTYHLLKMPLNKLSTIGSLEFAANDNKQLNCSLCSFVAKWPAELQKHAVSHSEERPFICMVCGSTYKWKWDLVKHFEKSHHGLPNPYKRREISGGSVKTSTSQVSKTTAALLDDMKDNRDEPVTKKRRMSDTDLMNMEKMAEISRYDEEGMDCYQAYDPNNNEDLRKKYANPEDDTFSQIQITNVQSLSNECDSQDEDDDFNAADETYSCTLVSDDVRQKLSLALKSNRPKMLLKDDSDNSACADILLPFKCNICEYRARWPSEITQHMKNHSDEKPYCCPQCSYRSKWKWDVVKHMKRCGGGSMGVKDVIDRSKMTPPPNAVVVPISTNKIASSQPVAYLLGTMAAVASTGQKIALIPVSNTTSTTDAASPVMSNPGLVSALQQGIESKKISKAAPVFRSLVNISQGLCHCLECPFVGLSPAELKRHSFLHSEAKPFTCNACGYSSRWKCDLKKHMKTYNHGSMSPDSNKSIDNKSDPEDMAAVEKEHENISVNRMLYKCTKCSFGTHNRNLFESHHKMHEQGENSAKFRCKQCDYKADDLSSFLQHKVSHTSQQQLVPLTSILSQPAEEVSSKSIHMKHRRKPVKQFCCTKCPYSCFKRSGLALHSAMHEPRGSEAVKCLYCDYNVYSKNLVIQHMRLHPEYEANDTTADSARCKEIMEAEEKYDSNMNNMFNNMNTEETAANTGLVPIEPPQQQILPPSIPIKPKGKFPCEWCPAAFPHVSHLYQHSKLLHPSELAAQENAGQSNSEEVVMPMTGINAIMAPKSTPPPMPSPKSINVPLQSLKSINVPLAPKMSVASMMKAKKSTSPQKKLGRQLACSKCSFVGTSPFTYLRHMDRHGSKSRHTCLYCDYSIDRLNLLYQHMKSTHGALSHKALTTEKAFERAQNKILPIRMTPDGRHLEKIDRSPMEISEQNSIHLNGSLTGAQISNVIPQDNTTWKAHPNKGFSPDGKKNYDCPKCDYSSNNPANTEHHVRQHGAKRRYKCEQCDYSVDNLRLVYNHIATVHQGNFPVMENLNSGSTGHVQQLSSSKLLNVLQHESNGEDRSDEPRKAAFMENVKLQQRSTNYYNCPKCPYKLHMSKGYRLFMRHREHHGYDGHFKCQQCDYSSDKLKVLYAHKKVHLMPPNIAQKKQEQKAPISISSKFTGRIRYRCSKCPYNTLCKSNIIKHRRQHLHKGRFKCELCNYSAARMYLLDNHMKFHDKKHLQTSRKQEVFQDIILDPFAENCLKSLDEMESTLKNQGKLIGDSAASSQEDYSPIRKGADIMRRHRCLHCPFESLSMSDVRKHSQFHEGNRRYGCQFCNYSVDRQNLLTRHQRVHGIKTSYVQPLPECHLLSTDEHQNELYQNFIGKAEPDSTSEIYRLKSVHNSITKRHMCSLCPFGSNSLNSYNIHSQMHGLDRKYICDYCNWSAGRMNLLTQHRYVHASEPNFNTYRDERVFLNNGTNKEKLMTTIPVVDNNIVAVKGRKFKKTYSCKQCPYTSMNKQSYTYHRLLHSVRAKYTCSVCSYSNGQWKQMNSHMGLHRAKETSSVVLSKRGRLRCPHCPYTSVKRKLLDVHVAMHASGRKHRCEFCNFSTDRINLLQQHQRVHTADSEDDTAYPRADEDKKKGPDVIAPQLYFSSPEDDLDEDSDEDEEEELNCERCPYSTPTKIILERHESQHTQPGKLACPYCDFGCDTEEGLLGHVQIHFPSSKLDEDTLQSLIRKQHSKKQAVRRELVELQEDKKGDEKKDGEIRENGVEEPKEAMETSEAAPPTTKTKVYVCQYCEREYEGKMEMQKHEKQHLVGYQY